VTSDKYRLNGRRFPLVLRPVLRLDGALQGDADHLDGHGVFKRDVPKNDRPVRW